MRIAALYDIHANLPALEAVLAEILQAGVDLIVVGGDVVAGPMPVETLACLQDFSLPVQFIRGNADREVIEHMTGRDTGALPTEVKGVVHWVAQQLSPAQEEMINAWPETIRVEVSGLGEVLFCHATPRSDTEVFTCLTPEERLMPIFEGVDVPIAVCGHTHMQFDRTVGSVRVLNAGSVGMPFAKPGAYWLLLGSEIMFRHTLYDLTQAAERIRSTDYPQADDFATNNVLQPPTEEEALAVFEHKEQASSDS